MSEVIRQRSRESHLDACVAQGGAYKFLIQKSNQRIKHVLVYLDNYSRVETGIEREQIFGNLTIYGTQVSLVRSVGSSLSN